MYQKPGISAQRAREVLTEAGPYWDEEKYQNSADAIVEQIELKNSALRKAKTLLKLLTVGQVIRAGDEAIRAAGLNPWCMNEGRADGTEPISLDFIIDALGDE